MEQKLCLYICSTYYPEVKSIIDSGNFPDVALKSYTSGCLISSLNKEKSNLIVSESRKDFSKILIIGGTCGHFNKVTNGNQRAFEFYNLDYCMELIFSKESINHFIGKKYYLISNGWLINYRQHIKNWGFDAETAKKYFGESADKILLLETGIAGDYLPSLNALSAYMGLPYEILPVGRSYCRQLIETLVFQWRSEKERNQMSAEIVEISRKTADFSLVFEQMLRLVDLTDETEIVRQVFILLNILFAPKNISYTSVNNNNSEYVINFNSDIPLTSKNNNDSFEIEVLHLGRIIGIFKVSSVAFVAYIEMYKPMKEVISRMSGLSIANARKYKIISDNEEQLKKNEHELTGLNETKDKFFSIIAHDLRGPLGSFFGTTKLLVEEYDSMTRDEIKTIAGEMMESSSSLFSLLENLLEWSMMQRGRIDFRPEQFHLLPKIRESINLIIGPLRKKSIRITYDIPDNIMGFSDAHMFDTVIRNLISNAVKFTPRGGEIDVSASFTGESSSLIQVKDTGIGIPAEMIGKLFKLNENTNRNGTEGEPSSGLGLLLCKEFVEKNGGKIWVNSEEGKGSCFFFTIPYNEIPR
jgi:hypothetical protein